MTTEKFQILIRSWHRKHGRHDLPWRKTRNSYRILVSEIMLQQTQVSRALLKYPQFLKAFPSMNALDRAPLAEVLRAWQGLGYNRRAVYLKKTARIVEAELGGKIPRDADLLRRLPGIGEATAGAIAAFAFGARTVFVETNIRRVYIHFFFPKQRKIRDGEILKKITATLPKRNVREWYYALMDYGAIALRNRENPNQRSAHYIRQSSFSGSRRQVRGRIIAEITQKRGVSIGQLREKLRREPSLRRHTNEKTFSEILDRMRTEGLIEGARNRIRIAR